VQNNGIDNKMNRTILFNAHVITMNRAEPAAELVCIEGNRIVSVGGNNMLELLKLDGCSLIDCAGMTLFPGFIDAHCHIFAYAESLVSLNLSPESRVSSIHDIQRLIRSDCENKMPGTWIRGRGYNEFCLSGKRHPNRWDLDAAASSHPVKLTHRSGHAHVLNSLALKETGITAETGDPPGGLIERDLATGEPTGLIFGMGQYLAEKVPPLDDSELERGVKLANAKLLSHGITSVQDASFANDSSRRHRLESWNNQGVFNPRISIMTGLKEFSESGRWLADSRPCGVKIIADQITGSLNPAQTELNTYLDAIHDAGLQAAIHAVEEPVIEAACSAVEHAINRHPKIDHRHRIEHCSVCPPDLLNRFAGIGIFVVTQPAFIYYSGDRYLETVPGEKLEHLYPIGSMRNKHVQIAFSSDFPIADPNPLIGIQAAVTRKSKKGREVSPKERISISEALYMYTMGGASASFEEGIKGSLEPGKYADIVALSGNPITTDPDKLKDIRVLWTMIGGRVFKVDAAS
jgi:predicted amidohydrolase YtcJ